MCETDKVLVLTLEGVGVPVGEGGVCGHGVAEINVVNILMSVILTIN